MAWDETTGIDAIDQELVRRGINPALLARLPIVSLTGGASRQDLPAPIERLKENPQNLFRTPVVSLTGQPNAQQPSRYDGVVPQSAADRGWLESAKRHEQSQREQEAERGADTAGNAMAMFAASRANGGAGTDLPPQPAAPSVRWMGTPATSANVAERQPGTRAYDLALGATSQPKLPVTRLTAPEVAPDLGQPAAASGTPAVSLAGKQPLRPTYSPETAKATGAPLVTFADTYGDEAQRGQQAVAEAQKQADAIKPSWMRQLGGHLLAGVAGFGGGAQFGAKVGRDFIGRPRAEAEQRVADAQAQTTANEAAIVKEAGLANTQSEIDARNREKTERPENLDREAYDYYIGQGMTPANARKRVLQDAESVKPGRQTHTSAFEAFAYGTPEEKKAAQDYLEFEKKLGARYRTPNEFDERFRLFKEDPDTYRAMFGDKSGSAPDRATATRMLNYFDKRRREVNGDFTLDDDEKKQQLQEIENLERPFMEAVQPGATGGSKGDRVEVIHPNGQRGTIPRSQLGAAKKKGYREAQPQ